MVEGHPGGGRDRFGSRCRRRDRPRWRIVASAWASWHRGCGAMKAGREVRGGRRRAPWDTLVPDEPLTGGLTLTGALTAGHMVPQEVLGSEGGAG